MHRPRYLWCLLLIPVSVGLLATFGCGGFPEEDQLVRRFFAASKMGDNLTLQNIAVVKFDPRTDGTVDSFSVVSVSPEQAHPLEVRPAAKVLQDAQAANADLSKRMRAYQDANLDAIDRVLKAEAKGAKLRGKDAEIQAAWAKWRQESAESEKKVSEARSRLNTAQRVAVLSLPDRDASAFDGTEYSKDVTVQARVRTPDGQSVSKTVVLTMERVVLKGDTGQEIPGRWMITTVKSTTAQ